MLWPEVSFARKQRRELSYPEVLNGYGIAHINAADVLRDADAAAASIASLVALPLHQPAAGPPPRSREDQGRL